MMLRDILTQDMVVIDGEDLHTPEEVLRFAGNIMVKSGNVSPEYVEEIVEGYRKIGPYFVMAPGVAMPHARPSEKVYKSGISFVRLKEPVAFNHPDNDPVTLVFLLAGTASGGHLDMIGELGKFLSDEETLSKLYTIKTYDELAQMMG